MSINPEDRLAKIINLHARHGTSALCKECLHVFPCPTRKLAGAK